MYQTIQESNASNPIVRELDANVAVATFSGKGLHKADLYKSAHSCNELVSAGSCSPATGIYVCTVEIYIN